MITVHHLDDSRSQRILWLLEELGEEYEIKEYKRDPQTKLAPRSLREIHPLGKAPIISHDGHNIAESGAITEYLVDAFDDGTLRPEAGSDDFLHYRYFMHYAEGSAMAPFLLKVVFSELPKQAPFLAKPVLKAVASTVDKMYISGQIRLHMRFWESELGLRTWFGGDSFSAADIQMSFPLEAAVSRVDVADFPNIRGFVDRIHERDAYKRALERGGPYNL